MKLRSCALLILILPTLLTFDAKASGKLISDELVQNLRCEALSPDEIYKSIKSDAFTEKRTYPIRNFASSRMSGHCWAIARFDRVALFLGRLQSKLKPSSSAELAEVARVRGTTRIPYTPVKLTNWSRTQLEVFQWPVVTHADDWKQRAVDARSVPQIREALEEAQGHLFYRSKNLPFVLKADYSVAEKRRQLALAIKLANAKKLPLINIRYGRLDQHIVVVTWIQRLAAGDFYVYTIDSNSTTARLRVKTTETTFSIVDEGQRAQTPVEMFSVVEEEDRPQIESALMSYYRRLCQ